MITPKTTPPSAMPSVVQKMTRDIPDGHRRVREARGEEFERAGGCVVDAEEANQADDDPDEQDPARRVPPAGDQPGEHPHWPPRIGGAEDDRLPRMLREVVCQQNEVTGLEEVEDPPSSDDSRCHQQPACRRHRRALTGARATAPGSPH
jgi:hypothetical protein